MMSLIIKTSPFVILGYSMLLIILYIIQDRLLHIPVMEIFTNPKNLSFVWSLITHGP